MICTNIYLEKYAIRIKFYFIFIFILYYIYIIRLQPPPPPPELCSMASRRMETKPVITCLKTLLIIYSFVFWITGVILLAVGVWGKLTLGTYISLIAENSTNAPYVLIGTGTTIVVFGLFGCFATCRGSPWMLKLVSRSQWNTAFGFCFVKMQIT